VSHSYIVDVYVTVPSYPTGTHEIKSYGFGERTLEQARARAVEACNHLAGRRGQSHRFEVHYFCMHCKGYGKEPGFKRKKCTRCGGEGRLPFVPLYDQPCVSCSYIGPQMLCPICGDSVELDGTTKDGRLIGTCGDAFTRERWTECARCGDPYSSVSPTASIRGARSDGRLGQRRPVT
jgi:hypothetical protein